MMAGGDGEQVQILCRMEQEATRSEDKHGGDEVAMAVVVVVKAEGEGRKMDAGEGEGKAIT